MAKSTNGSVSLLTFVSFPSTSSELAIVKSISLSSLPPLAESTTLESVTVKSIKGSVSLLTFVSFSFTSLESVMVKSIFCLTSFGSTSLESDIVKSIKGSVSLLTLGIIFD